jgi:uncharacterized integral membrane protein (TIGR00697 family)
MTTFQADLAVDEVEYTRYERGYLFLAAAFVVVLVLTNIVGVKIFNSPINGAPLTTGILTYPLTFLITDLVSEIYGRKRADFMVLIGFIMSCVMLGIVQLALHVAPNEYWVPEIGAFYGDVDGYQHAFESVFAVNGILLFGSMTAYAVAQLVDNRLYHFWKRVTKGKHLWLRNNASTWVSQLVDTIIVNSILFYIGFEWGFELGATVMFTIYWHKLILAALDTPLIYLGVYLLRKWIGDDPRVTS